MSTKMNIPITKPYLGDEEAEAIKEVLASGWLVQGEKVVEFEDMVKAKVGAKHAVACSNCTTALHMAMLALGIGKGDRVAVPAYTFVSTPNAVEYVGGEVVFVDINLETFNIDKESLWETGRVCRAMIPVHLFGLCADMDMVMEWARTGGEILADQNSPTMAIGVVEDAACSLGASCPEGMAGNIGDIGCFSFHPRKSITTGEGGMMTTNRDDIARMVSALRDFGFTISDMERHKSGQLVLPQVEMLGYNYRMTNMQGAMGAEQMKKFNYITNERVRRAEIYNRELAGLGWLRPPVIPEGYKHTYQSYCLLVGGDSYREKHRQLVRSDPRGYIKHWSRAKDDLTSTFKNKGIAIRGGTHACHMLPYYTRKYNLKPLDFPNTAIVDALLVTIPLFASMTDDEQQFVIDAIKGVEA